MKSREIVTGKRVVLARAALATAMVLSSWGISGTVAAQAAYPARTISLGAGFAPGGPTDTVARALAQKLSPILGQTVIVENRPGADGRIQLQYTMKAPPDGYQLALVDSGLIISALMYKNQPYNALKDFTPIAYLGELANVIAIAPSLNINSLTEFLQYASGRPGKLNYGTTTTANLLATEQLSTMAKLSMVRVPYKGAAASTPALMTGEIQLMITAAGSMAPLIKEGRVKGLAVTSKRRSPVLPEVPTTAEAGLPDYTFFNWFAIVGPANMPAPIVAKLNSALQVALADSELIATLGRMGVTVELSSGAKFVEMLEAEQKKMDQIITKANLKTE